MPEANSQNLKNHARVDPPYHFFLAPVMLVNVIYSGVQLVRQPDPDRVWALIVSLALVVAVLKIRFYSLMVQNRLIRLEERLRIGRVAGAASKAEELTEAQLVALRFASDAELEALVAETLNHRLDPKQIKGRIKSWRPDNYRV